MSATDAPARAKFSDPFRTARGETRAWVAPDRLHTLWFNTGTLCNLTCQTCYIEVLAAQRPPRLSERGGGGAVPGRDGAG